MPVDASPVKMCHAQECIGVEPLSPIQENDPESPACSVADDCDWGKYKRQEGPGWSVSLRQSRKGFKCQASIDALLSVGPDVAFDILTDPEVKQWRQVKVRDPSRPHTTSRASRGWALSGSYYIHW